MRKRWRRLFGLSLITTIAGAWMFEQSGASLWDAINVPLAGMVVGTVIAFVAIAIDAQTRWWAWAVLACWLPLMSDLIVGVSYSSEETLPSILFPWGCLVTPIAALAIGLMRRPAGTEPLARAQVR